MSLGMEAGVFIAYASGLFLIYFFGRMMMVPLKKILKILGNSLIGGICLILLNMLGTGLGIAVPVNIITALIAGILGLPGTVCMIIYFNG